jgi:hypothetical protein
MAEDQDRPIHPLKLFVGGLGAITGAYIGSFIGDKATLIGLGVGSVLSNGATSTYEFYLKKAHYKAQVLRQRQFGDWHPPKFSWRKWGTSTALFAIVTGAIVLAVITAAEAKSGNTFHGTTTHKQDHGTSIGGSSISPSPTPSPTVTPSVSPSSTSATPTVSPSATSATPTLSATPSPSVRTSAPASVSPITATPLQTGTSTP